MNALFVDESAKADLLKIAEVFGQGDADYLDAFIEQVSSSEEAKWKLTDWIGEHRPPPINIKAIQCFQRDGINVYRFRPLVRTIYEYRIIYAFDSEYKDYYVLAIVRKPPEDPIQRKNYDYYNYEQDHATSLRIRADYEELGIPKY